MGGGDWWEAEVGGRMDGCRSEKAVYREDIRLVRGIGHSGCTGTALTGVMRNVTARN